MILIAPFAQKLRTGKENPKNYPFWKELIELLKDYDLIQVGVDGEEQLTGDFRKSLGYKDLCRLVNECDLFISVDSFLGHLGWYLGKKGIVLWGQSDPTIFGHDSNINLLKDRKYLRNNQFFWWEQAEFRNDCWITPQEVLCQIKKYQN